MFGIGSKKKEVTVEKAGSLHLMIDDNEKLTITELTINGEINGTDLLLLLEDIQTARSKDWILKMPNLFQVGKRMQKVLTATVLSRRKM